MLGRSCLRSSDISSWLVAEQIEEAKKDEQELTKECEIYYCGSFLCKLASAEAR